MMSMTRKRAGVAVPVTYFHAAHTRMRWEPSSPDRPSRARRPVSSAPWSGVGAFWSGVGALRRSARRSEDRRRARAGDDRGSAARPRSASGWHRVASGRMLGCPGTGARLGRATTGPCEGSGHPGSGGGGGGPPRRGGGRAVSQGRRRAGEAGGGGAAFVPTCPIVVGVSWPRRPRAPGTRRGAVGGAGAPARSTGRFCDPGRMCIWLEEAVTAFGLETSGARGDGGGS